MEVRQLSMEEANCDFWYPTEAEIPERGVEVLGYNKEWEDADYNPDGIRICWIDDDNVWTSAAWCNTMDRWQTLSSDSNNEQYAPYNDYSPAPPIYWTPKPKRPIE